MLSPDIPARKRTCSFSAPRPTKAPRMNKPIRRTESYLSLKDLQLEEQPLNQDTDMGDVSGSARTNPSPCSPPMRSNKEQRERKRALASRRRCADTASQISIHIPSPSLPTHPPPMQPFARPRASSPLGPKPQRIPHPPRTFFPRAKREPNLYKLAITTRMRCSPNGEKILLLGPRLAVSVLSATRDLEEIVASQTLNDGDEIMRDATGSNMGNSWVFVPGEDWEIVDCAVA